MKKTVFFLLLATFFCTAASAQEMAQISFVNKDTVYDFGLMHPGDNAVYKFEFKNTGKEYLIISNVKSDNNDLKIQWPGKAVKPGRKGLIVVTYSQKEGEETSSFKNDIFITSNATQAPYPFLHVSGAVIPSRGDMSPASKSSKSRPHGPKGKVY